MIVQDHQEVSLLGRGERLVAAEGRGPVRVEGSGRPQGRDDLSDRRRLRDPGADGGDQGFAAAGRLPLGQIRLMGVDDEQIEKDAALKKPFNEIYQ